MTMPTNLDIGTKAFLNDVEWRPLLAAHSKRSSALEVSANHLFLKKMKERHRRGRDREFYNLVFWHAVMEVYQQEHEARIYTPLPHLADKNYIIMEYAPGIDLERLLKTGTPTEEEMSGITFLLGQVYKIKRNDGLVHGDFDPRHVILNGGLFLIDFEKAGCSAREVADEENYMTKRIEALYAGSVQEGIERGIESIPSMRATHPALAKVRSGFGYKVENRLREQYLLF